MSKTYKICSEEGWWNNDEGWCSHAFEGTTFNQVERECLRLPIAKGACWVEVHTSDMTIAKLLAGLE